MRFDPNNPIVQRCLQAQSWEERGDAKTACQWLLQAWQEATQDFEKFLVAHHIARFQPSALDRLEWLGKALHHALQWDDIATNSAMAPLYMAIAQCHADLGDVVKADHFQALAAAHRDQVRDAGPFYHGTRAALQVGDLLTPGGESNYKPGLQMRHIYFTAMVDGAGLAAALAQGQGPERVYVVVPTGAFEDDPNVTNKKFPGNPTRSYRSVGPLEIVGEVTDWHRTPPEVVQKWRERLAASTGEIID